MQHDYELRDIASFIRIANAGSLTRAAALDNVPKATLSHNLRRLEDALGVELFVRHTKGLALTEAGQEYLKQCRRIFDSCEIAAAAAQNAHATDSGKLRIAASSEFGTSIVGAVTLDILKRYPNIEFEIVLYQHENEVFESMNFDCMIYVGTPPDSSLLQRKLGNVSSGLYASSAFLQQYGIPKTWPAVAELPGVVYSRNAISEKWNLRKDGEDVEAKAVPQFRVHDYWMSKYFAVAGVAIAYLPDFFVNYEVEIGALTPIMPAWRAPETTAYVLYPKFRHKNPRVTMIVELLAQQFSKLMQRPGYYLDNRHF